MTMIRRIGTLLAALLFAFAATSVAVAHADAGDFPPRPVCVIVGYDNHGRPIYECYSVDGSGGTSRFGDDCWYCARYVMLMAPGMPTERFDRFEQLTVTGLALLSAGSEGKALDAFRAAAALAGQVPIQVAGVGEIAGKQLAPGADAALVSGAKHLVDGLAAVDSATALQNFHAATDAFAAPEQAPQ